MNSSRRSFIHHVKEKQFFEAYLPEWTISVVKKRRRKKEGRYSILTGNPRNIGIFHQPTGNAFDSGLFFIWHPCSQRTLYHDSEVGFWFESFVFLLARNQDLFQGWFVCWCFEPSQPLGVTSGLVVPRWNTSPVLDFPHARDYIRAGCSQVEY